jgi:hypothetical protein
MPKVYVVQEQFGKNILPAKEFGEIVVMLPSHFRIGFSAGQVADQLMVLLSSFKEEDYLLLIGDPVLIGIATAVASHWTNGKVRMLKWDRQECMYYPVNFDLFHKKGESCHGEKETF